MTVQAGLCRSCSELPKTVFFASRFILINDMLQDKSLIRKLTMDAKNNSFEDFATSKFNDCELFLYWVSFEVSR